MQVCVAVKALVNVGHGVSGVALAVDEDDFRLRMVEQKAQQLAAGVARSAKNTYFHAWFGFYYRELKKLRKLKKLKPLPWKLGGYEVKVSGQML